MSLHDKYFSSKNKQYVYSLLCDLILKETGRDIQDDELYLELYKFHYPKIFNEFSSDSLIELNKSLLDTVGDKILAGIRRSYREKKISVSGIGRDIPGESAEPTELKGPQKDIIYRNIYSSDRDIAKGHRYDYEVTVDGATFCLHKITVPSEGNSLALPTIQVELTSQGELIKIICCAEETKRVGDREYIVYSPQLQVDLPVKDKVREVEDKVSEVEDSTVHVRLLDQRGTCPTPESDVLPITQIKRIDSNTMCVKSGTGTGKALSVVKSDIYGLYVNGEYSQTLRILKIQGPYLLVGDFPLNDNVTYSLMNLSLQNHLVYT
jgi:hypothetical protein